MGQDETRLIQVYRLKWCCFLGLETGVVGGGKNVKIKVSVLHKLFELPTELPC